MNATCKFLIKACLYLLPLFFGTTSMAQKPLFPLKYSANKRYFTDQEGKPFLYNAETGWLIFIKLSTEEAREFLLARKAQGFNTIQCMLAHKVNLKNFYGDYIFDNDNDFTKPNEAYHDHIKKIIGIADSLGMLMVISQPWVGCCDDGFGNRPDKPLQKNGPEKNRKYGQYLGKKFNSCKNIFWMIGGDSDPSSDYGAVTSLAKGLHETAPRHQLITYHGNASHSSTDLFQYADWLGFSSVYTYWREKPGWVIADLQPHVYEAALREYYKSFVMPFVLSESQYEGTGKISNDMGTPQMVRRQAYWTMLSGGAGHCYGSDLWNFPDNWRDIMKYPGAYQMGYFYNLFTSIPWWTLIPDARHNAVVTGFGDWSKNNYVTTAVSEDKKLMVSYMPELQPITIDFGYLEGNSFTLKFYNPGTGKILRELKVDKKAVMKIDMPPAEDLVLVVQAI